MGHKPRERVLPEGFKNVAGVTVPTYDKPTQGLGDVYIAPAIGVNSKASITKQAALANAEDTSRQKGVAYKNAPAIVKTTEGKSVPNTVLGDSDYMRSLKIDSAERYNQMLSKKAFHPGNPEAKAIAKALGINSNGSAKKPRTPSAVVKAKKKAEAIKILTEDSTMENPVPKAAVPETFAEVPDIGIVTPASDTLKMAPQPTIEEIINGMGANKFTKMATPYAQDLIVYDQSKPKVDFRLNQ